MVQSLITCVCLMLGGLADAVTAPPEVSLWPMGAVVTDLTPAQARKLGYDEKAAGALILRVEEDGLAVVAGLRDGQLILRIDGTPVRSAEDARKALEETSPERGVLLRVQSPRGGVEDVLLKPPADRP